MRARKRRDSEGPAAELTAEERRKRLFERAAKLLAAKPRSIAELREKLSQSRQATPAVVTEVIDRLREYGYLDDDRFALTFASSKVRQKPIGRRRLERDLKLKKVDSSAVEEALDAVFTETPEEELIDRAIERRLLSRGRPKTREEAKSLFDHLLRQGFPFELVSEKVRTISRVDVDD